MNTQWSVSFKTAGIRLLTLGVIIATLLVNIGLVMAQVIPPRILTGDAYYYVSEWGGVEIWADYSIKERDPAAGSAKGDIQVTVYDPWNGLKTLVFVPECVKFEGNTVTVVLEVVQKTGAGNGQVGEHAKWQLVDGGSPGAGQDAFTIINYQLDPWIEYWPEGVPAPNCSSFEPVAGWELPITVTSGNLTVH
jgi:hypothetical protein